MSQITNNYAPGSCVFQAGSSQNGDVHIENCTIYQGKTEQKMEGKNQKPGCKEEDSEEEEENPENLQNQDTRQAFLFIEGTPSWEKEGRMRRESIENEAVRNREKARFLEYLKQHKMGKRKIFCNQSDLLNQVTVCFVIRWKEMGLTAPNPSGRAVFRFLREECGLQSNHQSIRQQDEHLAKGRTI